MTWFGRDTLNVMSVLFICVEIEMTSKGWMSRYPRLVGEIHLVVGLLTDITHVTSLEVVSGCVSTAGKDSHSGFSGKDQWPSNPAPQNQWSRFWMVWKSKRWLTHQNWDASALLIFEGGGESWVKMGCQTSDGGICHQKKKKNHNRRSAQAHFLL